MNVSKHPLLVVEPMHAVDIPAVMAIEREAFPTPWPEHAYNYELYQNKLAHYYVIRSRNNRIGDTGARPKSWRERVIRRPAVWAYGGFWLLVDEAHISTLATRRDKRKLGLGQLMLITLIDEAEKQGAALATLEVRESNLAAQSLYRKYGFEVVGQRPGYYPDNRETALIMTTPSLFDEDYRQLLERNRSELRQRLSQCDLGQAEDRTG